MALESLRAQPVAIPRRRFGGTRPSGRCRAAKGAVPCAAATRGCLTTADAGGTAMPTGSRSAARPSGRNITRHARGTGGAPGAGSSTGPRDTSTTAGDAGAGLVAVPPR